MGDGKSHPDWVHDLVDPLSYDADRVPQFSDERRVCNAYQARSLMVKAYERGKAEGRAAERAEVLAFTYDKPTGEGLRKAIEAGEYSTAGDVLGERDARVRAEGFAAGLAHARDLARRHSEFYSGGYPESASAKDTAERIADIIDDDLGESMPGVANALAQRDRAQQAKVLEEAAEKWSRECSGASWALNTRAWLLSEAAALKSGREE